MLRGRQVGDGLSYISSLSSRSLTDAQATIWQVCAIYRMIRVLRRRPSVRPLALLPLVLATRKLNVPELTAVAFALIWIVRHSNFGRRARLRLLVDTGQAHQTSVQSSPGKVIQSFVDHVDLFVVCLSPTPITAIHRAWFSRSGIRREVRSERLFFKCLFSELQAHAQ